MVIAVATTVDVTPPWICHMLVVFLSAFVGIRQIRNRFPVFFLSIAFGLLFAWAMSELKLNHRSWFAAWVYWRFIPKNLRLRKIKGDPEEFLGVLFFCWIAPTLIAWLTVRRRRRSSTRPPDDGDA